MVDWEATSQAMCESEDPYQGFALTQQTRVSLALPTLGRRILQFHWWSYHLYINGSFNIVLSPSNPISSHSLVSKINCLEINNYCNFLIFKVVNNIYQNRASTLFAFRISLIFRRILCMIKQDKWIINKNTVPNFDLDMQGICYVVQDLCLTISYTNLMHYVCHRSYV